MQISVIVRTLSLLGIIAAVATGIIWYEQQRDAFLQWRLVQAERRDSALEMKLTGLANQLAEYKREAREAEALTATAIAAQPSRPASTQSVAPVTPARQPGKLSVVHPLVFSSTLN